MPNLFCSFYSPDHLKLLDFLKISLKTKRSFISLFFHGFLFRLEMFFTFLWESFSYTTLPDASGKPEEKELCYKFLFASILSIFFIRYSGECCISRLRLSKNYLHNKSQRWKKLKCEPYITFRNVKKRESWHAKMQTAFSSLKI